MSLDQAIALAERSVQDCELYVVEWGNGDYLVGDLAWTVVYGSGGTPARAVYIVSPVAR